MSVIIERARVSHKPGFTIVELLIVIVVIGILAAITLIAYNGIQNRARISSLQSDLVNSVQTIEQAKISDPLEQYASSQAALNLKASSNNVLTYSYTSSTNGYCLQAVNGVTTYSVTNLATQPVVGGCDTNGLVGWWKFNGDSTDASSSGNNASANSGVSNTTGLNGQGAYLLDGSTGVVTVTNSPSLALSNFTISFWVKPTTWNTTAATTFISKRSSATSASSGIFIAYLTSSHAVAADCTGSGGRATTTYAPTLTQWTHIVVICTPTATTLFANDTSLGTFSHATSTTDTINNYNFGYDSIGTYALTGALDDIRIYGRTISTAEVDAVYAKGPQ